MASKQVMKKWGAEMDQTLKLLDTMQFKAEDLREEWPVFSRLLVQRRVKQMLKGAFERNDTKGEVQDKKSMPSVIDSVHAHVQSVIEEALSEAAMAKLFNMT